MASLRALIPQRESIPFGEALRIAELQATRLARLLDASEGITEQRIAGLPRVTVTYEALPVSGSSHWNGSTWVIAIATSDSLARQRFTLLHEFKHILDHGSTSRLYTGGMSGRGLGGRTPNVPGRSPSEQAELAADYFAGCALVPKQLLKAAWGNGIQSPTALADHFGVSEHAIRVRLNQTGLDRAVDREPSPRCARPVRTPAGQTQQFKNASNGTRGRSWG